ncbi:MAG: dihydroorotate dehydrogenase (quinone) [marine bacterium B5-7]|nr:MAG: dihydroorotate dehydrogenase (quinone) [marine bacterium B5-7]
MDLYALARSLLFRFDAETSHNIAMAALSHVSRHPYLLRQIHTRYGSKVQNLPTEVMGLTFKNPVGLAAGLDKQAAAGPALCAMGFGFIELGTVTPESQPGNPRPRMFRLEDEKAIINRMGFNSCGLDQFLANLRKARPGCITGINIGKNAVTPIAQSLDDYRLGIRTVYDDADYIAINVSSPNTRDLRTLQNEGLEPLLKGIRYCRQELDDHTGRRVPMALKIAPDLMPTELPAIIDLCLKHHIDAIIATNTTTSRPPTSHHQHIGQTGGLSGQPLTTLSSEIIAELAKLLDGALPIIAVGGIMSAADAREKLDAGATLVQIYSGFIFEGPRLVRDIVEELARLRS